MADPVPWVVRFVSGPDAARSTLLDVNAGTGPGQIYTLREGFSLGTTEVLTVLVESMLEDGEDVAASKRTNRELTIPVILVGDQATFAGLLGGLAREVDRKPAWLEFKPGEHTGESIFFQIKQGELGDVDLDPEDEGGEDEERSLTLSLVADFAAVGLEQTGTATTGTDPAGSSKPFVALPPTKGDVPAPLTVKVAAGSTDTSGPIMVNVCAGAPSLTGPLFVQAEALTAGTGVTFPTGDAAMSGGSHARITFGINNLTTLRLSGDIPAVPPGRYRVWARLRNTTGADTFDVRLDVGTATSPATGRVRSFSPPAAANSVYWVDIGDVEHPYYQPTDATAAENLTLRLYAQRTAGTGNLDPDLLMLVPLDLRGKDTGRTAFVLPTDALAAAQKWVIRPDQEKATPTAAAKPATIIGSHEFRAVPGANTYIHVLRRTYPGTTQLTGTNTVDWAYRPRYLYVSAPA